MTALGLARAAFRGLGIDTTALYQRLSAASLRSAIREQGLAGLCRRLGEIVPDLTRHYTGGFDAAEYARYWELKMRGLHAFQTRCALDALAAIAGEALVIADIGDSSGAHAAYIKALAEPGKVARVISVNFDPVAVEKVRAQGGDAILSRAEELDLEGLKVDLFMSFETIEHLTDPIRFLHDLASRGSAGHLLMTVPYRRDSRFGGALLRYDEDRMPATMTAEEVHMFELSPGDWRLLARFAGWRVGFSRIYRQYPMRAPLRLTQPLWQRVDHEGFLGLLLKRDLSLAERYADW